MPTTSSGTSTTTGDHDADRSATPRRLSASAGIVDVQVHVWYTDRPNRPWVNDPWAGRSDHAREVFKHQLALSCSPETALDEVSVVGVESVVLAPLGVYGYDCSLELEAIRAHPQRLVALASIDHRAPDVEQTLRKHMLHGFRGVRFAPMDWEGLERGEFDDFLRAAADLECPVFLNLVHPLPQAFRAAVRRFRSVPFVIDHLGVGSAPPVAPAGELPFRYLPEVLQFADEPNVWLKLSSAPALSKDGFPFRDIWWAVRALVQAYGAERIMWGSDFTRTNCMYSYRQGLEYLWHIDGLSRPDRDSIVGGTVRRLLGVEELKGR